LNRSHPYRCRLLSAPGVFSSIPQAIDSAGTIVGSTDDGTGIPYVFIAGPLTELRTVKLTKEGTQLEYKYTNGRWDIVEKDAVCGELPDRQLTLTYGNTGKRLVSDTVPRWRNVAPCGK
jgi:hypothetical protein